MASDDTPKAKPRAPKAPTAMCEAGNSSCGLPATGETAGMNHCDNHEGWASSGDAAAQLAQKPKGG